MFKFNLMLMYACVRCFGLQWLGLRYSIVECGHLALSSCLTLRAKHTLCLVVLKACVPKLCVLL